MKCENCGSEILMCGICGWSNIYAKKPMEQNALYPCQIVFKKSLHDIDNNPFEPQYQCDCDLADIHFRFGDVYPNDDHVERDIIKCCKARCKYLKEEEK